MHKLFVIAVLQSLGLAILQSPVDIDKDRFQDLVSCGHIKRSRYARYFAVQLNWDSVSEKFGNEVNCMKL